MIIGDLGQVGHQHNIIIEHRIEGLRCISDLHPSFMAMQYPVLFLFDEDDFRIDIKYRNTSNTKSSIRKYVTMREFYTYRIQQRIDEGKILIRGGRLFQQYIIDTFSSVEKERLDYIKRN